MLSELTRALCRRLLDFVAPRGCAACDEPCEPELIFCPSCGGIPDPIEHEAVDGVPVFAACEYAAPLSTAIHRLKYHDRPDLAATLAGLFAHRGVPCDRDLLLIPVPLQAHRLAERGYNQAALLARALASQRGLRCAPLGLRRTRDTEQQARLTRAERLANVSDAFEARTARALRGRRVMLVDDVVTTGATALACIHALRAAGARPEAVAALGGSSRRISEPR